MWCGASCGWFACRWSNFFSILNAHVERELSWSEVNLIELTCIRAHKHTNTRTHVSTRERKKEEAPRLSQVCALYEHLMLIGVIVSCCLCFYKYLFFLIKKSSEWRRLWNVLYLVLFFLCSLTRKLAWRAGLEFIIWSNQQKQQKRRRRQISHWHIKKVKIKSINLISLNMKSNHLNLVLISSPFNVECCWSLQFNTQTSSQQRK